MRNVLITTEALRERAGVHLDLLLQAGFEVRYPARNVLVTEDETIEAMQGFGAVIAGSEPYSSRVLDALPQLRVISRNGVGYDQIDVPAATKHGVAVTITPEGNHQAVAEQAMALMLAVARSVVTNAVDTRQGLWIRRNAFIPLRGSTLGIVGLGRIGRSVAIRAEAFGMRLVAFEQYPNHDFAKKHNVRLVDLDTLLAESDFVTLHTPMTPETIGMINRRTLAQMKRGSVLINTARGPLVNEADLLAALQAGHLAGAGLDVLSVEPPPKDHPLLKLEQVVVSPHVSSFDTRALEDMAIGAAQNLLDLFDGRWPADSMINPQVKTAWQS